MSAACQTCQQRTALSKNCDRLEPGAVILIDKVSTNALNAGRQLAERIGRSMGLKLKVSVTDSRGKQLAAIRITAVAADPALGCDAYRPPNHV